MSDVTIFAPSPVVTITIEDAGGTPDVHVHAGGQGVWQARMLRRLGVRVTLCCVLTGELGRITRGILDDDSIDIAAVERAGRGAAYVHDRRGGERTEIVESDGDGIARHDLDELYSMTLREGLRSRLVILSGPQGAGVLPAETYRRLAVDIRETGGRVIVDLAGERLSAALAGGVDVLKVSDKELRDDGLLDGDGMDAAIAVVRHLRERGAEAVILSRGGEPALLIDRDGVASVQPPRLATSDTRGAGDSFTAGLAAGLARGQPVRRAATLAAAAGALNVTRHGLGTGDPEAIEALREQVLVRSLDDDAGSGGEAGGEHVTPDGLAALADEADS
ncbi:PfkB family carbohydrate kinase [Microbacterium sp. LRZ72]|uniref:1-phosphofructokinase family hexose kinase n=1 Tax=Microbacterium sp. LRZ72 TaxID=2942481 RepID=UPI0029A7AB06|nr:PfkB family carbohydrate kinase [Microbacterium sp. LRZ72]MDX2377425.1 PfkB family carbohydrate kinase [Microbacterium sp. LRZ72]